jgi:hypothetical protein
MQSQAITASKLPEFESEGVTSSVSQSRGLAMILLDFWTALAGADPFFGFALLFRPLLAEEVS